MDRMTVKLSEMKQDVWDGVSRDMIKCKECR